MHNFEQVKDVIEYSQEIHIKLADFYDQLSEKHQLSHIKMLLDYLQRHERNLADSLSQYEKDAAQQMMNTWLQYAPTTNVKDKIKYFPIHSDMTLQEVIDIALDLDNALVELYRDVKEHVEIPELKELFQNLIDMEDHEKKRMVRDALMLTDL